MIPTSVRTFRSGMPTQVAHTTHIYRPIGMVTTSVLIRAMREDRSRRSNLIFAPITASDSPNSTWERMKDAIRYGWNKVTGKAAATVR
jgi:hypothetical protein